MDLTVDEFIDGLFTEESAEKPSDTKTPEEKDTEYPPWYDAKLFNEGRQFYWNHSFALSTTMLTGLVAVFCVPSILRVLVGSRRSSTLYTAYRRYLSTLLHTMSWFENDLKPGSVSWRSLHTVRTRHFRAGKAAKLAGKGTVSQRDIALTLFGFIGFAMLKPDKFGIRSYTPNGWEAYNHFWRVIGHMIGLEDRYNICRKNFDETRQVCQIILDRVYTPCLDNCPEYFEHMARVMLDGFWYVNPTNNASAIIYFTKYLANVPGYIYTEEERMELQKTLKVHLKGQSPDTGIDSTSLISKPAIEGLAKNPPNLLYYHDFDVFETVPAYNRLTLFEKYKLAFSKIMFSFYESSLGKLYLNWNYQFSLYLMKYFPYLAFFKFGIKASLVDIFVEDPLDDTPPVPNSVYTKPRPPLPWYKELLAFIW